MKTRAKLKFNIYQLIRMSHYDNIKITPVSLREEYAMTSKILLKMSLQVTQLHDTVTKTNKEAFHGSAN